MRLLKLALISLLILFVVSFGVSALLPSHVLVSRAVNIAAAPDSIRAHTADIRQWQGWMEGMTDTSVHIQSATQAIIGNTMVTIQSVTDTTVVSLWDNHRTAPQLSTLRWIVQPQQQVTIVQWQFEQKLSWYPWEKFASMMNDKILGPMMERNLEQLRRSLEEKSK
jgi:hypothetical protein